VTSVSRSSSARRGLALGVAALALLPVGILAGCGNGGIKQRDDSRPEPNASTEGVRSVYPSPGAPTPQGSFVAPRTGPPSPEVSP
jgi:hypothetical protein